MNLKVPPSRCIKFILMLLFLQIELSMAQPADTSEIIWYNASEMPVRGRGWQRTDSVFIRLPASARSVVREPVWNLAHNTAGLSIEFSTDAESLLVQWTLTSASLAMPHMPATGVSGVDLYVYNTGGQLQFVENGRPNGQTSSNWFQLPEGTDRYVLYLPLYNGIKELKFGVPANASFKTSTDAASQPTVVFYGTSIAQGGCASRPGLAWPTIVSRMMNLNGVNLGFSGNGQMEPEMAELLGEIDADIYVLDCLWNMTPQMVRERVDPFIRKLRSIRPETPILLAEDSHLRDMPGIKGELLSAIFARLVSEGYLHLYYMSNTGMLGTDGEGTVDGVHPNDLGMMRHAEAFSASLRRILKKD